MSQILKVGLGGGWEDGGWRLLREEASNHPPASPGPSSGEGALQHFIFSQFRSELSFMKKVQVILVSQARPKRPARLFLMERVRNGGGLIFSIFLALFPPPLPSQKKGGNIASIAKLPYLMSEL